MDTLKNKLNANQVKDCLRGLRKGIDAYKSAYEAAMERVESQSGEKYGLSKRIFAWIVHAKRQLHIVELKHALGTCIGKSWLDRDDFVSEQTILSVCAGLISYDNKTNIVRLVHYTAQEYFREHWSKWFKDESAEITSTCITYMSFSNFESGPCRTQAEADTRLKDFVLLSYAAKHWGDHAREWELIGKIANEHELEGDQHESPTGIAMSFLLNETLVTSAFQAMLFERSQQSYSDIVHTQALHLTSYFGITGLSALLLACKADINASGCFYDENVYNGSSFREGATPLYIACYRDKCKIVRLLLDEGADVNAHDPQLGTALHGASLGQGRHVAKLILDTKNVRVDSKDGHGRTPLSCAAWYGQEATVKQLLDTKQVDVDSKDNDGRSPISFAAQGGHRSTAVLLLKNMTPVTAATEPSVMVARLNSSRNRPDCTPDALGRTPPMWAALGGNISCIQSLWPSQLPTSSSTTMDKDSLGLSLIHLFAIGNCSDGIDLVLDAGLDVNEPDSQGWTPLHWAAYFGHKEVCEFLVDRAADKGLKDLTGRTAYWISLFVGAKQLNELLKPHLVQGNLNVLEVAQEFSTAYCDSCQRVSII
jgi:ankyrin repeat protein